MQWDQSAFARNGRRWLQPAGVLLSLLVALFALVYGRGGADAITTGVGPVKRRKKK